MPQPNIYGILDNVAGALVSDVLHVMKADAVAIRMFDDAAKMAGGRPTMISQHPADYDLVCLGAWTETEDPRIGIITPDYRVVLKGKDWLALQQPTNN